jgi:hypothetical protein
VLVVVVLTVTGVDVEAAVVVVDDVIGEANIVVDDVIGEANIVVDVALVVTGVVIGVAKLHDANSNDVTRRRLSDTKIIPFFIETSCVNNTFSKSRFFNSDCFKGSAFYFT